MTNSADPDQLASSEANWSGSTLFAKTGYVVFSKRTVNVFVGSEDPVLHAHSRSLARAWLSAYIIIGFTVSMQGKGFSKWHYKIIFLFFPENWLWYFMKSVSWRDMQILTGFWCSREAIALTRQDKNVSKRHFEIYFFFQKIGFDISCKLSL